MCEECKKSKELVNNIIAAMNTYLELMQQFSKENVNTTDVCDDFDDYRTAQALRLEREMGKKQKELNFVL